MWRPAATMAATAALLAGAAAPAGAATVSLAETAGVEAPKGQGSPAAAEVAITALPGETNRITATRGAGTSLILRDPSGPLTPGSGCATTAPGEVTCTPKLAPVGRLTVDAGDGDDLVDASGAAGVAISADGGAGDDTLRGGAADDRLRPGTGRDDVDGGAGRDAVSYDERTAPVTIALDGTAPSGEAGEGDALRGIEIANGGAGDDTLLGADGAEQLVGGAGDDDLAGRAGDDTLDGGTGDDQIAGDGGADALIGDAGQDVLEGGDGNDFLAGRGGADVLSGEGGDDTIDVTGDPSELPGELVACGAGRRDRVDSPAAFERLAPDCELIDVSMPGQDVQPLRLYGVPRVRGGAILVRVGCDATDCGDRVRARVTLRPSGGARPVRAAATLRAGQTTTLRLPRGRVRAGRDVRVSIAGTQVDAGEGLPVRGGFLTQLR